MFQNNGLQQNEPKDNLLITQEKPLALLNWGVIELDPCLSIGSSISISYSRKGLNISLKCFLEGFRIRRCIPRNICPDNSSQKQVDVM
jgi:hypothetical protein